MNSGPSGSKAFGWILLMLGGLLQVGWAIGVDYTDSFTDIGWDAATVLFLFASMVCLEYPMKLGIAFTTSYAVWLGIGVVCTIVVSAALGLEDIAVPTCICLAAVIAGVVGLKLTPVETIGEGESSGGSE